MSTVIYALDDARIVFCSPIITNKLRNSFGFAFQSVSAKQSVQEAADALSFNARGAIKPVKTSHMICDTFGIYEVVPLTRAMESRTASTAYRLLFSADPAVSSWHFPSHSTLQVFHA